MKISSILRRNIPAVAISVGAFIGLAASPDNDFEIAKNLDIFSNVFRELNTYYVDEINPEKLMRTGLDAMLKSLDPYTVYIAPSEVEGFQSSITGRYAGIGASVGSRDGNVIISDLYENSPAQKAGIKIGDVLVSAEGNSLQGKTTREVSDILRGLAGTDVKVEVQRNGETKNIPLTIRREEIRIPNVPYYGIIDKNTAYIALSGFSENAGKNVTSALMELKSQTEIKSVVLDLRGNSGGLLSEAVNVCNVFVRKGETVVQIKGKDKDQHQSFRTLNHAIDLELPLAVLIDHGSASASEIVAGAIQDLDRGVVIGQRSYGKGLVQNTRDVGYKAKVKLTSARYYIPSGRCIQTMQYKDGKPVAIADSARAAFKTRNGRTVYDGGGIQPDIVTEKKEWSKLRSHLEKKFLVFDYATQYTQKHNTITAAANFSLGDADFKNFLDFLQKKNYTYLTETEQRLQDLEKKAKEEQYLSVIEAELAEIKKTIERDKAQELKDYKDEILHWLQTEIARRYYFERGALENSVQSDKELQRALETLRDQTAYNKALGR